MARGADAVMFFQWRQSVAGSEKFHSAMVPHGGATPGSGARWWTSGAPCRLAPCEGSRVESRAAIVFDYEAWWASEIDSHPSQDVKYLDLMRAFHRSLFLRGIPRTSSTPSADLAGYDLVLLHPLPSPMPPLPTLLRAAEAGATVLVSYFSGIVDERDHIRLGGYPGAFRDLLGITERGVPSAARRAAQSTLSDGTAGGSVSGASTFTWLRGVRRRWPPSPATRSRGVPALTRQVAPAGGAAWYLATLPDRDGIESTAGPTPGRSPEWRPSPRLLPASN